MVRPTGKQSVSAFEKRPMDYEPSDEDIGSNSWRWRWNRPEVLCSYEQAMSYWNRHPKTVEGLTFVIHPFGKHEPRTRLICLDFDKAVSSDGEVDKEVDELVFILNSYTEFSKSGRGLHVFVLVQDCPAFANCLRRSYGGCNVDILCSNAVNVTGEVYNGQDELATIPFSELDRLPFFELKEPKGANHEQPEWWSEDPLEDIPEHLQEWVPAMMAEEAVEGRGGSLTLFAAACRLMRQGIIGREAEALLRLVPASPPFPPEQIQRVVECAYNQTVHDGEFNNPVPEFEDIPEPPPPTPEELAELGEEDREDRYGFNFMSAEEMNEADLTLEYLVDGAFVGEGSLFIGGREKTFKTCIATDLLISLATGTPFLGYFPVLDRRRSVLFTAEIGMSRAKTLLTSVCQGRGMSLGNVRGLDIVDSVPQFMVNDAKGEKKLRQLRLFFKERRPEVAVFDPFYFAMGGAAVGDMYEMGAILREIVDLCKDHDVWPIFCHHAKKDANKEYEPMDLGDFYGSGVGAFARQWILLSHSEPFHGGIAKLFANIGGSSQGSRGIFEIEVDEGQEDELANRRWDVKVNTSEEEIVRVTRSNVLQTMDGLGLIGHKELAIHMNCKEQTRKVEKVLHELVREGLVSMKSNKFELSSGGFPND